MERLLNAEIHKSTQSAHQADGSSPLSVVGETSLKFTRDGHEFLFEGLVVETLDVDVLAGIPFMEVNDITIRPAKHQIILRDNTTYVYGSLANPSKHHTVRRTHVLRAPSGITTVWPGEFIEVDLQHRIPPIDSVFALEPRPDTHCSKAPHKT